MANAWTVYKRELRSYLVSPIPYVFVVLFVVFMAWYFFFADEGYFFVVGRAAMPQFFSIMPWVLIFLVPAISMRLWSDEILSGTIEMVMTLPTKTASLVVGKFMAAWTLLGVALLVTLPIPITVANLGDLDWGPVWGGYFGAMLLGGALLALGVWISGLTRHQMVAFLMSLCLGFVLIVLHLFGPRFLQTLSLRLHYDSMGRGVIDLRDVIYFASFILFFLYLNIQSVENRRVR